MTAVGLASFARLPREGAVGAVLTYVRAIRTGRAATTVAAGPAVTDQPAVTTGTALAAVRASHGGVGAVTALAAVATTVHGSAGRAGHTLGGAGAAGATLPTGAWVTTIAADPALATVVSRANRSHLIHFATANLRKPGQPVPANLGPDPLRMARDLVRRGLDASALDVYRVGQNVAWQRWTEIAFGLTTDPQELHELLTLPFRSASEFIDATLAGLAAQMQLEYDELTRDVHAEHRRIVELILDGAPISRQSAEAKLGYPLDRSHTAAIIWYDDPDDNQNHLDHTARAFGRALGCPQPLIAVASAATRWVWVSDAATLDTARIHQVLDHAPHARIAVGTTARGIDGFRRSHRDALATQRMLARLRSQQRLAFFADIHMIAVLTENPDSAADFITSTLGDLESASPQLLTTVLTYINEQCNASRAAHVLHTHRNTLLRRLETAQRLLPRPLDHTIIQVAVAISALQWRGSQTSDPVETPVEGITSPPPESLGRRRSRLAQLER